MKELVRLQRKTHSYLRDNNNEDKKAKGTKKCVIKRKLKFQDYKNCLEAAQTENKTNYLEKNVDSLKKDKKKFIKNKKLILQIQQRRQSERHSVFSEKINKTALSSNDDKRMQSIDSIETYAYGTSKNLVSDNKEI